MVKIVPKKNIGSKGKGENILLVPRNEESGRISRWIEKRKESSV
jgi:hypothetical protein